MRAALNERYPNFSARSNDVSDVRQRSSTGLPYADSPMEKYVCSIVGVYSNNYMSLDAKSGMVGEYSFAEQMGAQLRLQ